MSRLMLISAVIGLSFSSPVAAALEDPDAYSTEIAAASPAVDDMTTGSICVPPEPQYIPEFIRNSDGTIVGINYMIFEYVC